MNILLKIKENNEVKVLKLKDQNLEDLSLKIKERFYNFMENGYFSTNEDLKKSLSENFEISKEEAVELFESASNIVPLKEEFELLYDLKHEKENLKTIQDVLIVS